MYDTINMVLAADEAGGVDLLREVPARLTRCKSQTVFEGGGVSITGFMGSLKVGISEQAVKINDSSLCKWYLGDNFQTMTRGDTRLAIENLSDLLHLPMDQARVTRIDVAQNFIMQYDLEVYFNHMGPLVHFNRLLQPNGLYYQNGTKTLVFYDKVHEQAVKKQPIPELYRGRQVLRYEQRNKNRLLQCFNLNELRACTLYDPAFYSLLVDRWRLNYKQIRKLNDLQINYSMVKTKKDQATQALLFYITQRGGELSVINEIKEAFKRGELTKKQAHDLRSQVVAACRSPLLTAASDVILELDKKVKEAARFSL